MPSSGISRAARALVSQRRVVSGTCTVCGEAFLGRPNRLYCTKKHAVAAYRARKRQYAELPGPSSRVAS